MSGTDLEAGVRWNDKIQQELSETKLGIVVVTPENTEASWLLFEAGALAKTIQDAYVCPYLIDLDPSKLKGPLAQFQAKLANRADTQDLVRAMNRALGSEALDQGRLDRSFDVWWPKLEPVFSSLPAPGIAGQIPRRTSEDMLEELLLLVRNIENQTRIRRPAPEPPPPSLADYFPALPFSNPDPEALRYYLTRTMTDRDHLKVLYNVLRDRLAEMPREEGGAEAPEDKPQPSRRGKQMESVVLRRGDC